MDPGKYRLPNGRHWRSDLDEIKFQERLKSYGWSDKLKSKIKQIRQDEQDSITNLENATIYDDVNEGND